MGFDHKTKMNQGKFWLRDNLPRNIAPWACKLHISATCNIAPWPHNLGLYTNASFQWEATPLPLPTTAIGALGAHSVASQNEARPRQSSGKAWPQTLCLKTLSSSGNLCVAHMCMSPHHNFKTSKAKGNRNFKASTYMSLANPCTHVVRTHI